MLTPPVDQLRTPHTPFPVLQASYQHAFSAIRQLALALRNALSMKTADSFKEVSFRLAQPLIRHRLIQLSNTHAMHIRVTHSVRKAGFTWVAVRLVHFQSWYSGRNAVRINHTLIAFRLQHVWVFLKPGLHNTCW